ncbi:unnamed protein product [Haemonchus placei]|uniref:Uncharacterized protein n=1 Tax=Haemonchus placei TaxID=6290 RepID=A0A3P7YUB0_HAEPC|nr:unnamed protein product [Haemonchus placei]
MDVEAGNCILRNEASLCTCVQQKNHWSWSLGLMVDS